MQAGVRINPVPGVDYAFGRRDAPMAQPPRKWAVSGIPKISPQFAAGRPPVCLASRRGEVMADRQPGWAWLTMALPARQPGRRGGPFLQIR